MSEGPSATQGNDVYTVLVILATIVVVVGTIYLGIRGQQLFGTWNPFALAGT